MTEYKFDFSTATLGDVIQMEKFRKDAEQDNLDLSSYLEFITKFFVIGQQKAFQLPASEIVEVIKSFGVALQEQKHYFEALDGVWLDWGEDDVG